MKKISIITPTLNQAQYIEQTIDSVLSQHYDNLEYIIIDGGSSDNTVDIIKKYEKHLTYWVSEKDNGQSDAINKGLNKATGEIVNWLNSDDYYAPNALHSVAKHFEDETILVVAGKGNVWKNEKIIRQSSGTDIYDRTEKTIGGARIDQPETFFRKPAIDKMGLLCPELHYVMDREWWIRYLLLFGLENIKKTDEILINFRIHEASKTSNFQQLFYQETIDVFYSLAENYNLKEAEQLKEMVDTKFIPALSFPVLDDTAVVRKSIHYFWYFQGCMQYAQNNYYLAKRLFQYILPQYLTAEDQQTLQNIQFRMKVLPVFLKKMLHKK